MVPLLICFSSALRRDSKVFAMHKLDQTHCWAHCIILLPFENKQDDATVYSDPRPSSPVPMYLCNSCRSIVTYETCVSLCISSTSKGYSRPRVYIQIISLVDCKLLGAVSSDLVLLNCLACMYMLLLEKFMSRGVWHQTRAHASRTVVSLLKWLSRDQPRWCVLPC